MPPHPALPFILFRARCHPIIPSPSPCYSRLQQLVGQPNSKMPISPPRLIGTTLLQKLFIVSNRLCSIVFEHAGQVRLHHSATSLTDEDSLASSEIPSHSPPPYHTLPTGIYRLFALSTRMPKYPLQQHPLLSVQGDTRKNKEQYPHTRPLLPLSHYPSQQGNTEVGTPLILGNPLSIEQHTAVCPFYCTELPALDMDTTQQYAAAAMEHVPSGSVSGLSCIAQET